MTASSASPGGQPEDTGEQPEKAATVPTISVVIPTYNDVGRIGDALTSIVGQTLPPAEIVVCDDGSDDGTERFVREFAEGDTGAVSIRYVRLQARSGSATARNEGVAVASGEWIAACDSDDLWAPTKLERQVGFLRDWSGRQPIAVLGTHGYNVNDAKRVISPASIGPTSEEQYRAARERGDRLVVLHSSILFPRSEFSAVGGYSAEYGNSLEDVDFVCRMAERGVVICLPERLIYYRKRPGSAQLTTFWGQRENAWRLMVNQRRRAAGEAPIGRDEFAAQLAAAPAWQRLGRRKRLWGLYYYRAGATDMVNSRRLRGAGKLLLASVMDGRRLRSGVRNAVRTRLSRRAPTDGPEGPAGGPEAPADGSQSLADGTPIEAASAARRRA
jgi:glycosyltransferase involved in cell wall biosynthesis